MSALSDIFNDTGKTAGTAPAPAEPATPAPQTLSQKIGGFFSGMFGGNKPETPVPGNTSTSPLTDIFSAPPAPVATKTGSLADIFASPASKSGQSVPSPYFYSQYPSGATIGASSEKDASGKPFLGYRNPGDTATTTDKTRVATTFDPTKAQKMDANTFYNPRDPNVTKLRTAMGTAYNQELDHIQPLELSGSNNKANLQNENNVSGTKNTATDPLENSLKQDVASGKKSLVEAQIEMAKAKGKPAPWVPPEYRTQGTSGWDQFKSYVEGLLGVQQAQAATESKPASLSEIFSAKPATTTPATTTKPVLPVSGNLFSVENLSKIVQDTKSQMQGSVAVPGSKLDTMLQSAQKAGTQTGSSATPIADFLKNAGKSTLQSLSPVTGNRPRNFGDVINMLPALAKQFTDPVLDLAEVATGKDLSFKYPSFNSEEISSQGARAYYDEQVKNGVKPDTAFAMTALKTVQDMAILVPLFRNLSKFGLIKFAPDQLLQKTVFDTAQVRDYIATGEPMPKPLQDAFKSLPNDQKVNVVRGLVTEMTSEKPSILGKILGVSEEEAKQLAAQVNDRKAPAPQGTLQLPGYKDVTPSSIKIGLSAKPVEPVGFAEKPSTYTGETDLTTKVLTRLEGRDTVSKQFISDLTNNADLKQQERDIVRSVLEGYTGEVPVKEFAAKVKAELLPLTVESSRGGDPLYEHVALPDDVRGSVANYDEHVYQSPVKNSAGDVHFSDNGEASEVEGYFGHTRIEDMADGSTRRIIEVQSDLYQKGRLEREIDSGPGYKPTNTGDRNRDVRNENANLELEKKKSKLQQYSNPTAHFRMVREEIKQAAKDGKSTLLFPTGETAMKIEGLGSREHWGIRRTSGFGAPVESLKPENMKVGQAIFDGIQHGVGNEWIITDVLGDGKFKAIQARELEIALEKFGGMDGLTHAEQLTYAEHHAPEALKNSESFDISGKVDTNNPIYRFYEKDLVRYLKSNFDAVPFTDDKGVTWNKVLVKPEVAKRPVLAFNKDSANIQTHGNITQGEKTGWERLGFRPRQKAQDIGQGSAQNRGGLSRKERSASAVSGRSAVSGNRSADDSRLASKIQAVEVGRDAKKDAQLFSREKITRAEFISRSSVAARKLGLPTKAVSVLKKYLSVLPETVLKNFDGTVQIPEYSGVRAMFSVEGGRFTYGINPAFFDDSKYTSGNITRHEMGAHVTYAFSKDGYRLSVNNAVNKALSGSQAEIVIKDLFKNSKGNYVPTVYSYYESEIKGAYAAISKMVDRQMASEILQSIGISDKEGNIRILSDKEALPYFEKTQGLWNTLEAILRKEHPDLWDEKRWQGLSFERSYSQLRNEALARYSENPSTLAKTTVDAFKDTEVARTADLAQSDPKTLFKGLHPDNMNIQARSEDLNADIRKRKGITDDPRETLKNAEDRAGVKPVLPVKEENISLKADREDRLAANKGTVEMKKIDARASFADSLKIRLPADLEARATALEIRRQELETSPLNAGLKYIARNGEFKGRVPEVTGKPGRGDFAQFGDRKLSEITGTSDSEKGREMINDHAAAWKKYEADAVKFKNERQAFLSKARSERDQIIENQKIGRMHEKMDKRTSDIQDEAARKERVARAAAEGQAKAQAEVLKRTTLQQKINAEKAKSSLPTFFMERLKQKFFPVKSLEPKTKSIIEKWYTDLSKATETAQRSWRENRDKGPQVWSEVTDYEAGKKTPYIFEAEEALYDKSKKNGIPLNHVEDHLMHIWDKKGPAVMQAAERYLKSKGLSEAEIKAYISGQPLSEAQSLRLKLRPDFSKARIFPDYKTGIKFGLRPKFRTPAQIIAYETEALDKAIANKKMIETLKSEAKLLPEDDKPDNWIPVTSRFAGRQTLYAEPRLAEFLNGRYRDEENLSLGQMLFKGMTAVTRASTHFVLTTGFPGTNIHSFGIGIGLYKPMTTAVGALAEAPIRALTGDFASSAMKIREAGTALKQTVALLRSNFTPWSKSFMEDHADDILNMSRAGIALDGRSDYYTKFGDSFWRSMVNHGGDLMGSVKELGETPGKAVKDITVTSFNTFKSAWNKFFALDKTWELMNQQKVILFGDTIRAAKRAGMDDEAALKFAADVTRKGMGIPETPNSGRSMDTEEQVTSMFIVPQYREGVMNILWNGFKGSSWKFKDQSYSFNRSLVVGAVLTYVAYNIINKKLNGHYMWDNPPGREFSIRLPQEDGSALYTDMMPSILTIPRNAAEGAFAFVKGDWATAGQKASSVLSLPLAATMNAFMNKDYFGRPIYNAADSALKKAEKVSLYWTGQQTSPAITELVKYFNGDETAAETFTRIIQLPIRFSKATTERYSAMQDLYDSNQKFKLSGRADEANKLFNALSDADKKIYTQIKRSTEAANTTARKPDILSIYKSNQQLIADGNKAEADAIYYGLSQNDQRIYSNIKKAAQKNGK